jgi:hypothetical protein
VESTSAGVQTLWTGRGKPVDDVLNPLDIKQLSPLAGISTQVESTWA